MESNDCQESSRISSFKQLLLVMVSFLQPPKTSHNWHQVKRKKQRQQGSNFRVEELGVSRGLENHINYPCALTGFLIEDGSHEGRRLCNGPAPKLGQLLPYELWGLTPFPGQWEGEPGILNCSSYKTPQPAPLTPGQSNLRKKCLAASLSTGLQQGSSQRKTPFPRTSTRRTKAEALDSQDCLMGLFSGRVHRRQLCLGFIRFSRGGGGERFF